MTNPFRTMSDDQIGFLLFSHDKLAFAFANVRPSDRLMILARKTVAWADRRAEERTR